VTTEKLPVDLEAGYDNEISGAESFGSRNSTQMRSLDRSKKHYESRFYPTHLPETNRSYSVSKMYGLVNNRMENK
jgi:hypothetical protein